MVKVKTPLLRGIALTLLIFGLVAGGTFVNNAKASTTVDEVVSIIEQFGDENIAFDSAQFKELAQQALRDNPRQGISILNSFFSSSMPYRISPLTEEVDPLQLSLGMIMRGDRVVNIFPNSNAASAGLQVGDTILSVLFEGNRYEPGDLGQAAMFSMGQTPLIFSVQRKQPSTMHKISLLADPQALMLEPTLHNAFSPTVERLADSKGIFVMSPMLLWNEAPYLKTAAAKSQGDISRLNAQGIRKWIIDLRVSLGDHHHNTALASLGPLLPQGLLAYEIPTFKHEVRMAWHNTDGRLELTGVPSGLKAKMPNDSALTPIALNSNPQEKPCAIAVLISDYTEQSSVGQLLTMVFSSRPNARIFGWNTSNRSQEYSRQTHFPLDNNGTYLSVRNRRIADSQGNLRPKTIFHHAAEWDSFGTLSDSLVKEASLWLSTQNCQFRGH